MRSTKDAEVLMHLRILKRLYEHSITHPITIPTLSAEFGISERDVKLVIETLRHSGHKICSRKERPMGMFVARDPIEARPTAERLHREGIRYLATAHRLMDFGSSDPTLFEGAF
jgi:hypothetical protein